MVSICLLAQKALEIKGFLGLERPFLDLVSQSFWGSPEKSPKYPRKSENCQKLQKVHPRAAICRHFSSIFGDSSADPQTDPLWALFPWSSEMIQRKPSRTSRICLTLRTLKIPVKYFVETKESTARKLPKKNKNTKEKKEGQGIPKVAQGHKQRVTTRKCRGPPHYPRESRGTLEESRAEVSENPPVTVT